MKDTGFKGSIRLQWAREKATWTVGTVKADNFGLMKPKLYYSVLVKLQELGKS